MGFELIEDQKLMCRAVRDFAERGIASVARELDEKEQCSVELTQKMAELRLVGSELQGGDCKGFRKR